MSDAAAQLHGPGGILATPGLISRRKGRKWGQRLKDSGYSARAGQTIRGNLARGGDGKFTAAGNASAAKPKPKPTPIKALPKPKRRSGGKGRAAAKPKAPKATPEQRQAERDQERAAKQTANRDAVKQAMADQDAGLAPGGFDNLMGLAAGAMTDQIGADSLVKMGMAERGGDGTLRLTESGRAAVAAANRGDTKAAIDAVSRGADAAKKRSDADAKRAAAEAKKLEPKPEKPAGGGSKKPSDDEKRAQQTRERAQRVDATAAQVGLSAGGLIELRRASEQGGVSSPQLFDLGFVGPDGMTTDQGRRALTALERGDVRGYNAALQDAKARMGREQAAAQRRQQAEGTRTRREQERTQAQQRKLDLLQRRARAGAKLTQAQRDALTEAGLAEESGSMWRVKAERYGGKKRADLDDSAFAGPDRSFPIVTAQDVRDAVMSLGRTKHDKDTVKRGIIRRARAIGAVDALPESWREKSFAVFKDHAGQHRWLARTTTAYKDRDEEIIMAAALDRDSQRMTQTKQFGPLRYWHVGQPDPFDTTQPWGPGLDIGDCDYSVLIGRTRIESGTFRDPAIALKVAGQADQYELSPGFFHPIDEPVDGVFSAIRTFERSIVPRRYGRASNLFTGLAVKEQRMDINEMEKRFKAAIADLGLDPAQAAALGQQLVATEKAAAEQGISFKSDEQPATEPTAPAPRVAGLHADSGPASGEFMGAPEELTINGVVYTVKAAPPMAEPVAVETQADGMVEEIVDEAVAPDESAGGPYVGDLTPDEFFARLDEHLAPVLKMQDMVKSIGDAHAELKTMYGGTATKEAGVNAELVALKAQQAELAQKIAAIEGNQPATILPDEVAAALKSEGPTTPDVPDQQIKSTPERPLAAAAAALMPELYYSENGWQPRPAN